MASDSINPCGHHPDSGCTCRPPGWTLGPGGERIPAGFVQLTEASGAPVSAVVVSKYQPLVDRAEEFVRVSRTVAVFGYSDLAELVRDLAKALAER